MHSPSISHPTPHKQVPAKVTAYVDEDIKELIEVINSLEGIWTSESCQGYKGELVEVLAHYHSLKDYDFLETAQFVEKLTKAVKQVILDEIDYGCHNMWISLGWGGDMRFPYIKFECGQADRRKMTKILNLVRQRIA